MEVEKKKPLFLHCGSGVTRSPTAAIIFLCIYKKIQPWNNIHAAVQLLKGVKKDIFPNIN